MLETDYVLIMRVMASKFSLLIIVTMSPIRMAFEFIAEYLERSNLPLRYCVPFTTTKD